MLTNEVCIHNLKALEAHTVKTCYSIRAWTSWVWQLTANFSFVIGVCESFQSVMLRIGELRSLIPNLMALTATAAMSPKLDVKR